jgi:tetratricopeptide (TPR) repeat protein
LKRKTGLATNSKRRVKELPRIFCIASDAGPADNPSVQARDVMTWLWPGKRRAASVLAVLFWWTGFHSQSALGMSAEETNAFTAAFNLFDDGHYSFAESNFNNFLNQFTNSSHRADAILYLARARLEQSNYSGAISLLESNFAGARNQALARDYVFWIAKAHFSAGDYERAAEGFSNFAKNFPDAPARIEAAYDEADACARMKQWPEVIGLLQPANGVFHQAAADNPKSDFVTMGSLLLGEALFAETNYSEAEKVVSGVDTNAVSPDFRWRRQYLRCQIKLAAGDAGEALNESTNLLDVAFGPRHQAESVFLQGEILEKLGRLPLALQTYIQNLDNLPEGLQAQALARTVELTVSLHTNAPAEAIQALEGLARRTRTNGLDVARFSLGELYLQAYFHPLKPLEGTNAAPAPTNCLEQALTNFTIVIRDFAHSPLTPKAHLDRAWCYWAEGKFAEAKFDFAEAANTLPFSEDQAVARFKLADAQLADSDYDGAAANYKLLLEKYKEWPAITNGLFDLALYQLAEADIHRGDDDGARVAVGKILEWYPVSFFGDRGLLLVGEDLDSRKFDYAAARKVFRDVLERSPDSPLAAEAQYAIAQTYDHERDWPDAISQYNQWATNYSRHPLLPEVEFSLGLAYDQAGMETNALVVFSNFVVRFSTNALAAWAQNWVADYHYDRQDFPTAEKDYQVVFQKFAAAGNLAWHARLMAGKAALAHLAVDDARQYFLELVASNNAPAAVANQGWFALGDAYFQLFQSDTSNPTNLNNAVTALSRLTNGAPTNAIAVEALGRLGDYYGYWADINKSAPYAYAEAIKMYGAVVNFPPASVSVAARSQAEVGLGMIAEKQHQTEKALEHYLIVIYEPDPNRVDPYWLDRAGEFAARLCEAQQKWEQAIRIYRRLIQAAPALGPVLNKKIAAAQSHSEAARN